MWHVLSCWSSDWRDGGWLGGCVCFVCLFFQWFLPHFPTPKIISILFCMFYYLSFVCFRLGSCCPRWTHHKHTTTCTVLEDRWDLSLTVWVLVFLVAICVGQFMELPVCHWYVIFVSFHGFVSFSMSFVITYIQYWMTEPVVYVSC